MQIIKFVQKFIPMGTNAHSEGYLQYIMAEMHNLQVYLTSSNFVYHNTSLRFTIIMQVWQVGRLS